MDIEELVYKVVKDELNIRYGIKCEIDEVDNIYILRLSSYSLDGEITPSQWKCIEDTMKDYKELGYIEDYLISTRKYMVTIKP